MNHDENRVFMNEFWRRLHHAKINEDAGSAKPDPCVVIQSGKVPERLRLEAEYGQVWTIDEVREQFTVVGFLAPYVDVTRKSDGQRGTMQFQHNPRFYFGWEPDDRQ